MELSDYKTTKLTLEEEKAEFGKKYSVSLVSLWLYVRRSNCVENLNHGRMFQTTKLNGTLINFQKFESGIKLFEEHKTENNYTNLPGEMLFGQFAMFIV